jgi:murein DD-endopeptidase MepM/ murein hydrolase activator NlpD
MQKKTFVLRVGLAVALSAVGLAAPAAADQGPIGTPIQRPAPAVPSSQGGFGVLDTFIRFATSLVGLQKASDDEVPAPSSDRVPVQTAGPKPESPAPAATPARASAIARSYPRTFSTYDALTEYATQIATTQKASDDRLAALVADESSARATLATVFDPRLRGGLLKSRVDLIDDATIQTLQAQVAQDVIGVRDLVAGGAIAEAPPAPWQLPLRGEDTQDFGSTPYWFEPGLTYGGIYYSHFHTGTDIATAWGTPIVAPAHGVVIFAGTMGDGAEVVVLAHDAGLVSMYAHLDNHVFPVPVKAGDTVEPGDRIGNVGLTGITTGAHLHWSVWRSGELIDPLSMIKG